MYGKYSKAKSLVITSSNGEKVSIKNPAGYSGIFFGSVYDSNDNKIKSAENYFIDEDHDYTQWDIISEKIDEYCAKYIDPLLGTNPHYSYQCGFGGKFFDGLIDFWLPVKVPELPNLAFEIKDKKYTMKWEYSSWDL